MDANVLFSAAYRADNSLLRLWDLPKVTLLSSGYAAGEARMNLPREDQVERLDHLLEKVVLVPEAPRGARLPAEVALVEKDRPILLAAIHASASHLLTGDVGHFASLFGQAPGGVVVLRPAVYLRGAGR